MMVGAQANNHSHRPAGKPMMVLAWIMLLTVGAWAQTTAPVIDLFSPTGGPAGTIVSVFGRNFTNAGAYDIKVSIGGTECDVLRADDRELFFIVDDAATSGPLRLETGAGAAQSSDDFIISPLTVTIQPTRLHLFSGYSVSRRVLATATGGPSADLTWAVNGIAGGNAEVGTITPGAAGAPAMYQPPATIPSGALVVTATSVANPAVRAAAPIRFINPAGGIPDMDPPASRPDDFIKPPELGVPVAKTHVLVLMKDGASLSSVVPILNQHQAQIIGGAPEFQTMVLEVAGTADFEDVRQAVNALAASPQVEAADFDSQLFPQGLPPEPTDKVYLLPSYAQLSASNLWKWDREPTGFNWGQEYADFPQAWNLFHFVNKINADLRSRAETERTVNVGELDTAVEFNHQDLTGIVTFLRSANPAKNKPEDHGTHVAGIIGANYTNRLGGVGASPFAHIYSQPWVTVSQSQWWPEAFSVDMIAQLRSLIRRTSGLRVINFSQGYNWHSNQSGYNYNNKTLYLANSNWKWAQKNGKWGLLDLVGMPANNPRQSQLVRVQGMIALAAARWIANPASGHQAIFVASAGNDRTNMAAWLSNIGYQDYTADTPGASARRDEWLAIDAEYNSPFCWAAYNGASNIVVVEALAQKADRSKPERTDFSCLARPAPRHSGWNYGFAAPGQNILSCSVRDPANASAPPNNSKVYQLMDGTSMAAPMVTGLIAYLCAVDPDLTIQQIIKILQDSSRPWVDATYGNGPPAIRAFEAIMAIDAIHENIPAKRKMVKRALLNVDDGTMDGNDRNQPEAEDQHGSGIYPDQMKITMADFRRFRDAWLQVNNRTAFFDGPADSSKRDLNGDGLVKTPDEENIYPRCDFDGDSSITLNDLDAFADAELWQDEQFKKANLTDAELKAELEPLLDSGDYKLDPGTVFNDPDIDNIKVSFKVTMAPDVTRTYKTTLLTSNTLSGGVDKRKVLTIPAMKPTRIWAVAYKGTQRVCYLLSPDAQVSDQIHVGEDKVLKLAKVGVKIEPKEFTAEYKQKAVINVNLAFEDGAAIAIIPDFYQINLIVPSALGTYVPATSPGGYTITCAANAGIYTIQAQVAGADGEMVNPESEPYAKAKATVRTAMIQSPGGMALDSVGNMYVSDSQDGSITMIPPGGTGEKIVWGLDHPGDVEVDGNGRSLIVTEKNGVVTRKYFGLTGKVTDPKGSLLMGALVTLETPAGTIPGEAGNINRIKTNTDGEFTVLDLLRPEMGPSPNRIVVNIEYQGQVQAYPVTLKPVGHTVWDFLFTPEE